MSHVSRPSSRSRRPRVAPRRALSIVALTALAVVAASAALVVVVAHLHFARILSDSMTPGIKRGDAVVVRPTSRDDVSVGQVVLLPRGDDQTGPLYAHRIVDLRRDAGTVTVQTKGDANPAPDSPWVVIDSDAVPLVVARLPLSRLPLQPGTAHTLTAVVAVVGLLVVWAAWPLLGRRHTREPSRGTSGRRAGKQRHALGPERRLGRHGLTTPPARSTPPRH